MKNLYKIIAAALVFISLSSLSCQALTGTPIEPTSTPSYSLPVKGLPGIPSPTPLPSNTTSVQYASGELLFSDDFSNLNSGWDQSTNDNGSTSYVNEQYRIFVSTPNYYYWSNPGISYADVIIEVEAKLESGSTQNDIGIICRLTDNENFYFLTISSDGYYQIAKFVEGKEKFVGMDQYGFNSDVIKENDINLIRAECIGDELALTANNTELARVTDSDLKQGDVGLIAGTYEEPEMSVLFDNFKVYAP